MTDEADFISPTHTRITHLCAVLSLAIGVIGFSGWVLNVSLLARYLPQYPPIVPNAALLLTGISLGLLLMRKWKAPLLSAAALSILLGILSIIEVLAKWNSGINDLLFQSSEIIAIMPRGYPIFANHLSPVSGTIFILLGAAILLLNRKQQLSAAFSLSVNAVSSIVLLSYAYHMPWFGHFQAPLLALPTAIGLFALSTGILFSAGPRVWPINRFTGQSTSARMLRSFLPIILTLLLLQDWTNLHINLPAQYSVLLSAVKIFASIALLSIITVRIAQTIGLDIDTTQQALRRSEETYRSLFENLDTGVMLQSTSGRILSINPAVERILGAKIDLLQSYVSDQSKWLAVREDGSPFPLNEFPGRKALQTQQIVRDVIIGIQQTHSDQVSWLSITAVPLNLPGQPTASQVITTFDDITGLKQAEHELRSNEQRLREMIEKLPAGAVYIAEGRIRMNAAVEKITGYAASELQTVDEWFETLYPGRVQTVRQMYEEDVASKFQGIRIVPIQRKDGSLRYVEFAGAFAGNAIVWLLYDMDDRLRAEQALRESEERFRQLADNIPEAFWLIDVDTRQVIYSSAAQQAIWGQSLSAILNQPGQFREIIHPEDQALVLNAMRAYQRGEKTNLEYRFLHPDGTHHWLWQQAFPVYDVDGNFHRVAGITADITERKIMEAALNESREWLDLALNSANIGIWDWDILHDHIEWNEKTHQLFGVTREQFGHTIADLNLLIHPEDREIVDQRTRQAVENNAPYENEFRAVWPDGSIHSLIERGKIYRDPQSGQAIRMVGISWDITERRQAEEEVRRLNADLEERVHQRTAQLETAVKELESFSYSVSHDLHAPLRAMNGFSEAILEDYGAVLDSQGRQYLQRIIDNSQHMARLIDGLLNLARVTRAEINWKEVDLSQLARRIRADLCELQPERCVDFQIDDDITAQGDEHLLYLVLQNLLQNAWKFTGQREKAVIRFRVQQQDGHPVYSIEDNGVGFNMEYSGQLFRAFYRLHPAKDFEGTGIGLATVQRIIHRHGGKIWATGSENEGAVFYFTLKK